MFQRFFLWLVFGGVVGLQATDVRRFELNKGRYYYQVSEGVATLQTNNAFRFSATIYATDVGDVLSAAVTNSKGGRRDLSPNSSGDPFEAKDHFDSQFQLDNTYPNGAYIFLINTLHDGSRSLALSLTGDAYPAAPVLKNVAALQNLPYNAYVEIAWQPFVGGTVADFVQLKITDINGNDVFKTPDFAEEGALNGIATKSLVPPGTLKANALYDATLLFGKVLSSGSAGYPNTPGRIGYFTRTEFYVRAVPAGLSPAIDKLQLWKTQRTEQLEDGAPFLQPKPYELSAQLDAVSTNAIAGATVTFPSGATNVFDPKSDFSQFDFSDTTQTNLAGFNATYGSGAYGVNVAHRDGSSERVTANFAAGGFPPAPELVDALSLSNHRADMDLPVSWKPWPGAGESDFIRVELYDENNNKVWDTSGFTSEQRLRANATNITISADQFIPGRAYELRLTFFHTTIFDNQNLGGGVLYGGYAARTKFAFATQPADALSYGISEGEYVWQRGDTVYESNGAAPFVFEASALASSPGNLNNLQLTVPAHGLVTLSGDANTGLFRFASTNATAALLAGNYPTGVYAFRFDTLHDGVRTAAVTLASTDLPPVPHVRNFSQLPIIRAGQDAEISWDPWIGFQTNTDNIQFTLFDALGNAVDLSGQTVTPGAITNIAIFHDTLKANQSYLAKLRFERKLKIKNDEAYPGPRASALLFAETWFYISTLDRTKLISETSVILNTSRQLQFRVTPAFTGRRYRIETTANFSSWTPLQTNLVTGTALQIATPPTQPQSFFRAVLLP